MSKQSEPTVHKDIFGRLIEEGSYVAFPADNTLHIGTVGKCTAKMVRVHPVNTTSYRSGAGYLKYARELVTVAGTDVTFYVLKNSK